MFILVGFLLVLFWTDIVVTGHPVNQFPRSNKALKPKIPTLSINVTDFPRGLIPILIPLNHTHKLPLKSTELTDGNVYIYIDIPKETNVLQESVTSIEQSLRSSVTCSGCMAGIYFIKSYLARPKENVDLQTLIDLCMSLNMLSTEFCEGLMRRTVPELTYILSQASFDVNELCTSITMNDDCLRSGKTMNENWEISLPSIPKPSPKNLQLPKINSPTFKVLHLTDTHHDPLYAEGANALCKEPVCCRDKNQIFLRETDGAGNWGDYRNCDLPKATIDNMFDHIAKVHPDIDYIIWTGDVQPHNVWSETKNENLVLLRDIVATVKNAFPKIAVFPAIGNHEGSPVNSFPHPHVTDPKFSNQWLLDEIDVLWRQWLPDNVSPTIRYGGFYSVLIRPGLRILSINTNYCYSLNFWLMLNATDPASHLQWLVYELQAAEIANEKVHIIGHIPPGYNDCLMIWSRNYYKIIARFESTVTAQFFGHTHGDEFEVFYDPDDINRPINVAYIAPSVTPFTDFNPGYKIYYVDGDHPKTTRMVIDAEGWIFNLRDANIEGTPNRYKLYSTRSSYGMDGLRPSDWNEFINQMTANDEIFDLYHKHYWRDSPKRPKCDSACKNDFICNARSGRNHDRKFLCEKGERKSVQQQSGGFVSRIRQLVNSLAKFVFG